MSGWSRCSAGVHSNQQERRQPTRWEAVMMHRGFSKLLLMVLLVAASATPGAGEAPPVRTPPTNDVVSLALSPDGLTLAVAGRYNGRNHLWLKPVGVGEAKPLLGTADGIYPFWS